MFWIIELLKRADGITELQCKVVGPIRLHRVSVRLKKKSYYYIKKYK